MYLIFNFFYGIRPSGWKIIYIFMCIHFHIFKSILFIHTYIIILDKYNIFFNTNFHWLHIYVLRKIIYTFYIPTYVFVKIFQIYYYYYLSMISTYYLVGSVRLSDYPCSLFDRYKCNYICIGIITYTSELRHIRIWFDFYIEK